MILSISTEELSEEFWEAEAEAEGGRVEFPLPEREEETGRAMRVVARIGPVG